MGAKTHLYSARTIVYIYIKRPFKAIKRLTTIKPLKGGKKTTFEIKPLSLGQIYARPLPANMRACVFVRVVGLNVDSK